MIKKIKILLCAAVLSLICACDNEKPQVPENNGVGTCVPVLVHDEFIFLCWYEIIDVYNMDEDDVMLEEYLDPSTEWRLRKLKEAGFNTYFDYRLDSLAVAEALLDLGDKVGINIIVECPELHDPATTEMAVEAMSAHPSLYGYNVWDEPELFEYPEVIRRIKEIYKYDKARPCYVNLFPNYGWDDWVEEKYLNTVRHYLQNVPVSFLSFDYYPVSMVNGKRQLNDAWYHNMEDIRTAALEADVPIWAFAAIKAWGSNPRPTLADLRLQQFTNLVYGAVAFQYFTARGAVWYNNVTSVYDIVKQVNHELKQMEPIFLGADIKDIWHTGEQIPRATKPLTTYPSGISRIETEGPGMVVSYLTNKGRQYIAFVNRSCTEEVTLKIEFDSEDCSHVAKDGSESTVNQSYVVDPGDIRIFTWK